MYGRLDLCEMDMWDLNPKSFEVINLQLKLKPGWFFRPNCEMYNIDHRKIPGKHHASTFQPSDEVISACIRGVYNRRDQSSRFVGIRYTKLFDLQYA